MEIVAVKDLLIHKFHIESNKDLLKIRPKQCNFKYSKRMGFVQWNRTITHHYTEFSEKLCWFTLKDVCLLDPHTITTDDKIILKKEQFRKIFGIDE